MTTTTKFRNLKELHKKLWEKSDNPDAQGNDHHRKIYVADGINPPSDQYTVAFIVNPILQQSSLKSTPVRGTVFLTFI